MQKAEELQPDLIVLDIGLPTLNGIEVARRIRKLRPECKMLFMSQESSADVAQETFRLGAMGYVVKSHAGSELFVALEEVCQGRQFVSKGLSGHTWVSAAARKLPATSCVRKFSHRLYRERRRRFAATRSNSILTMSPL